MKRHQKTHKSCEHKHTIFPSPDSDTLTLIENLDSSTKLMTYISRDGKYIAESLSITEAVADRLQNNICRSDRINN